MDMREYLQRYLDWGLTPIPLAPRSKKPVEGFRWSQLRERPAEETVFGWFNGHTANVGLLCGTPGGGLVALDFDGQLAVQSFLDCDPALVSTTPHIVTGRGGHIYLLSDRPVRSHRGDTVLHREIGVDVVAERCYVVAPPSVHPSGKTYTFQNEVNGILRVDDVEGWLRERLDRLGVAHLLPPGSLSVDSPRQQGEGQHWLTRVLTGTFAEGERNAVLTRLAGYLRNVVPEDAALALCLEWNRSRCAPPLGDSEVIGCVRHKFVAYPPKGAEAAVPAYRAISLAELASWQELEVRWCVDGVLPAEGVLVLVGDAGAGKTWLLADLALSVASGEPWLGQFSTTKGPVVVLDEENSLALLKDRYTLLASGRGLPLDGAVSLVASQGINLSNPSSVDGLLGLLSEHNPALVVMDSLVRFHSADENSAQEMSAVFEQVGAIRRELGCAVAMAHHARKLGAVSNRASQMARGTTDIRAFVDSHVFLRKSAHGMTVEHEKSRFSEPAGTFAVQLVKSNGGLVLAYVGEVEPSESKEERAKALVRDLLREGSRLRTDMLAAGKEAGVSEGTMENALGWLRKAGEIESDGKRPASYSLRPENT